MIGLLLGIVGILYLGTGLSYALDGNFGMALAFTSYSLANIGLYYGAR